MLESTTMPHKIEIPDDIFARLQAHAKPFVDTPADAIRKLLEIVDGQGKPAPATAPPHDNVKTFSLLSPPDLTHTKVLSVEFLGAPLAKNETTWNGLLNQVILAAHAKVPAFVDLKKVVHVNMVPGKKEDEGYRYLPQAAISVQGQDANAAWQAAYHASAQLGFAVDVTFLWRHKEEAAFPGETGRFKLN